MLPFNVQSKNISKLKLWRLPDDNFRILQDGEFTDLISGPGHILVDETLVNVFKECVKGNLRIKQTKILDQVTKEEYNNFYELIIEEVIDTKNINLVKVDGFRVWAYKGEHLFVSPELKELLQQKNNNELEFSEGFSFFG